MIEFVKQIVNIREPLAVLALFIAIPLLALRTKTVPKLLFDLLREKLTRERFSKLLGRFMMLGFSAFIAICVIVVSGQFFAYKTRVEAAPIGDLLKELQKLKPAPELSSAAERSYATGIAFIEKKDLDNAIRSIQESLDKIPTLSAEYTLAYLYKEKGDERLAQEHAEKASRLAVESGNPLDQVKVGRLVQEITAGSAVKSVAQEKPEVGSAPGGKIPFRAGVYSYSFSDSYLAPEWKMVNPDAQRWTLQPKNKSILIITQSGSLSDSKNLKNWLILRRDLPTDDFEVIVAASIRIQNVGNELGVALFSNDQNYIYVKYSGESGLDIKRTSHFGRVFQGQGGNSVFDGKFTFGSVQQVEPIFLKIDRGGNEYSGSYAYADKLGQSVDDVKWVSMGTLPWINFEGKLVLFAANFQGAPEVAAEFYSIQIRQK
jgi:tetratricopeptide (TPR) repeat protein